MNKLLTTRQVREILGVQLNTVYEYIASGKLKAHKLGGNGESKRHWRIKPEDLEDFVRAGGVSSFPPTHREAGGGTLRIK